MISVVPSNGTVQLLAMTPSGVVLRRRRDGDLREGQPFQWQAALDTPRIAPARRGLPPIRK